MAEGRVRRAVATPAAEAAASMARLRPAAVVQLIMAVAVELPRLVVAAARAVEEASPAVALPQVAEAGSMAAEPRPAAVEAVVVASTAVAALRRVAALRPAVAAAVIARPRGANL